MGTTKFTQRKNTLLIQTTDATKHWNIFLYQFIPLGKWRSEATCIRSSRAPSISESVLRTYLFRREGVEETLLNPLISQDVKLQHNGGNQIKWRCSLQGWAPAAQSLLYPCSKAASYKAGMVCSVPMPTHIASLEQGWKKHRAAFIYVPRSSCRW